MRNREAGSKAAWFVTRLYSGDMTATEEAELKAWLEADPTHRHDYDAMLALWDAAGGLADDIDILAAGQPDTPGSWFWRHAGRWAGVAAAILVVSVSLLVTDVFDFRGDRYAAFETATGEQRTVNLKDGSSVMLNTGTRVLIDFTPSERRVILDYGEAFFDVAKDPDRPLIVSAGGRAVTVLGTRFSVLLAGKEIKVAVEEGSVAVGPNDPRFPIGEPTLPAVVASSLPSEDPLADIAGADGVVLQAGSVAVFRGELQQVAVDSPGMVNRLQSWRDGVVRFEDEQLFRVVGEINRYSRSKILIEDADIMDLTISGVFRLDRVDLILASLEDIHPVEVVRYPDRYVLIGINPAEKLRESSGE